MDNKEFVDNLKKLIDERTEEKFLSLYKLDKNADKEKIRQHTEEIFLIDLQNQLEADCIQVAEFSNFLQEDDPALFEKINGKLSKHFKIESQRVELPTVYKMAEIADKEFDDEIVNEIFSKGVDLISNMEQDRAYYYFKFLSMLKPTNPEVWQMKGLCEQSTGKINEALNSYYNSIKLDPDSIVTYIQIVYCLVLNNNISEAKELFDEISKGYKKEDYEDFINEQFNSLKECLAKEYVKI